MDGAGYVRRSTLKVRAAVERSIWLWLDAVQDVVAGIR
jgi:hypothetical protein